MQSAVLPKFACDVRSDRDRVVVAPSGDFDLAQAPALAATLDELIDAGFANIVVDLRQVCFLDSTGLRTLIVARRTAGARDARLSLVAGPPEVHRIFELTGTEPLFSFDDPGSMR
jgi:anti-sigma B factor antagonist